MTQSKLSAQSGASLEAGQVWRNRQLGSDAEYRVVEVGDEILIAEVITAPGLLPGRRLRFTHEAVRAMELVTSEQKAPSEAKTRPQPATGSA